MNVYADSLNVGNDLLTGNGIAKFVALRTLEARLNDKGHSFDYVIIDLPPSFGGLVRSALYSSDYLIIPCTSDTFSEYCISLIGQMLPQFVADWETGIARFKQNNYGLADYDKLGKPCFGGWIFNGYDTRADKMLRADKAHFENISQAVATFNGNLKNSIKTYDAFVNGVPLLLGSVEDMDVLIQNSMWQSVPVSQLDKVKQVDNFTNSKAGWSANQLELISKIRDQLNQMANTIISEF